MRLPKPFLALLAVALLFLVLLAAVGHRARASGLGDLTDLAELHALIDRDRSVPRLVLLLSPT